MPRTLRFDMADGTGDVLVGKLDVLGLMPADTRPLAILIHGLTGCDESSYIRMSASSLLSAGHPVLRLNLRGAGATVGTTREQYHAGRSEDLRAVIAALPDELTGSGIVLMAYSLGANMALKYLGEGGSDLTAVIRAAIAVSAPIDLAATAERFIQPRNRFYHDWIMRRMRKESLASGLDDRLKAAITKVRTIVEFDDRITAHRNGFNGAGDYYARCSATGFLDAIKVPTLVVQALNDPWIPARAFRERDWQRNPIVRPALAQSGGHVGFHDVHALPWHDRIARTFLDEVSG